MIIFIVAKLKCTCCTFYVMSHSYQISSSYVIAVIHITLIPSECRMYVYVSFCLRFFFSRMCKRLHSAKLALTCRENHRRSRNYYSLRLILVGSECTLKSKPR